MEGACSVAMWKQLPGQRWCCDTNEPIEGGSSLRHCYDNPEEDCDYLVFRCDPLNTADPFSFAFRIRHGFDPSNMNNWQLVLGAAFSDGQGTVLGEAHILSGLVLGVNYSGSDDHVKIWQVENARVETLLSTGLNYQEEVGTSQAPLFRVDGDGNGNLSLSWTPDPSQGAPEVLGSCRIGAFPWGRQLVVRHRYTSARDRALWLDGLVFEGRFEKDTLAPGVSSVLVLNEKKLQLAFWEPVLLSDETTFSLHSEAHPEGMGPESLLEIDQGIILSFPEVISNRVAYRLRIGGVADLDGNNLKDTLVDVMRNEAQWGDLVFNEIMADPDPAVRLSQEYLELFKRSPYPADLNGWKLEVNDRGYELHPSVLESRGEGEFILIKGITLPNEGAVLSLYSKEGTLIHAASYGIPWDEPDWKKDGGWSLESPHPDQLCRISASWVYSNDPQGGTPGLPNSNRFILVDSHAPVLLYAGIGDPGLNQAGVAAAGALLLHYSEPVQLPRDLEEAIRLEPWGLIPDSARLLDPLKEILQLYFPGDFQDRTDYQLRLPGMRDCEGNLSDDLVLRAGAVTDPSFESVLINEIMYDPEVGEPKYVELLLPGTGILDLQDLALHLVEEGASPDHPIALSSHSRLFLPGQHLVLTECVQQLEQAYGLEVSGQWVELKGLSGLKGSSGTIYLTDRAGQVIDQANYSDGMHMELLDDPRGISLERISPTKPGTDAGNWHSAASIAGYATPGKENSQSALLGDSDLLLDVQPEVFSPDNDGYEDILKILVNTGGNDWVIGLVITDLQGNMIRKLANNHLAAPSVSYTWDGEDDSGAMQPMGFYVIHARGYRPTTGEQWIKRKAVGLVYR